MAVQGDLRVDNFAKKNGKSLGHDKKEERAFLGWKKISEERTLGTMAIFMGDQERKVFKILKTLQPESDGWPTFHFQGCAISAEETYKEIHQGLRIQW
jgi:hypothetical protein